MLHCSPGQGIQASLVDFQSHVESGHITDWSPANKELPLKWVIPKEKTNRKKQGITHISAEVACIVKLFSYITGPTRVLFKNRVRKNKGIKELFHAAVDERNLKVGTLPKSHEYIFHSKYYVPAQ